MSRTITARLVRGLLYAALAASAQVATSNAAGNCGDSPPVRVCVTSAAITLGRQTSARKIVALQASLALVVVNTSDYPVSVAFVRNHERWSFSPTNAEAIVPRFPVDPSGFTSCWENQCDRLDVNQLVQLEPGVAYRAQVRYQGDVDRGSLGLVQIANTATFATTVFVVERGRNKFIPVSTGEFAFGNGVVGYR